MTKNDGGPAFPVSWMGRDSTGEQVVREQWGGMSLRDWFAGMALISLRDQIGGEDADIATYAYAIADAMLKAGEE